MHQECKFARFLRYKWKNYYYYYYYYYDDDDDDDTKLSKLRLRAYEDF